MSPIRIPQQLADAVNEDEYPARCQRLAAHPELVFEVVASPEG